MYQGYRCFSQSGNAVNDDEEHEHLRRQEQRAGDDKDDRGMEDAPAVELKREQLRDATRAR